MAVLNVPYDESIDPNERGYNAPPEGIYQLELTEYEECPPKEAGKFPQLRVICDIAGSPDGQNIGKKVNLWISLSPRSTPYFLMPLLDAIGVNYEAQGGQLQFDPDFLVGCVVQAKCSHEIWNGKLRDKWQEFEVSTLAGEETAGQPQTARTAPAAPQAAQAAPQQAAPAAPVPAQMAGQGNAPPRHQGRRRVAQ